MCLICATSSEHPAVTLQRVINASIEAVQQQHDHEAPVGLVRTVVAGVLASWKQDHPEKEKEESDD